MAGASAPGDSFTNDGSLAVPVACVRGAEVVPTIWGETGPLPRTFDVEEHAAATSDKVDNKMPPFAAAVLNELVSNRHL